MCITNICIINNEKKNTIQSFGDILLNYRVPYIKY